MLDIIKKTSIGLGILFTMFAVVYGYNYLISMLDVSKNTQIALAFTPILLFVAYTMGDLRLLNSKKL